MKPTPAVHLVGPIVPFVEKIVVGSCLADPQLFPEFCAGLRLDAFTDSLCHRLWGEILACHGESIPWTRTTICQRLHAKAHLDLAAVCDLPSNYATSEYCLPIEVAAVRDAWLVRRLMLAGAQMGQEWVVGMPVTDALSTSTDSIAALQELVHQEAALDVRAILESLLVSMRAGREGRGLKPGVLPRFEALTGGYMPSCLYVFGARPSVGKTALVTTLATAFATQAVSVLLVSTESTKEIMALRCLANLIGIDAFEVRAGRISAADLADVRGRMPTNLEVDDNARRLVDVLGSIRRWRREHPGPAVVLLDYLELVTCRAENREQELSRVVVALQEVAKQLQIPIVLLSQLARRAVEREGGPGITDFRGSGMIEQAADVAALMWRPKPKEDGSSYAVKLYCGKNKIGGTTFTLDLTVDKARSRIAEAAAETF